jgi:hypothetical protein
LDSPALTNEQRWTPLTRQAVTRIPKSSRQRRVRSKTLRYVPRLQRLAPWPSQPGTANKTVHQTRQGCQQDIPASKTETAGGGTDLRNVRRAVIVDGQRGARKPRAIAAPRTLRWQTNSFDNKSRKPIKPAPIIDRLWKTVNKDRCGRRGKPLPVVGNQTFDSHKGKPDYAPASSAPRPLRRAAHDLAPAGALFSAPYEFCKRALRPYGLALPILGSAPGPTRWRSGSGPIGSWGRHNVEVHSTCSAFEINPSEISCRPPS